MPREAHWLAPYAARIRVAASLAALAGAVVVLGAIVAVFASFIWPASGTGDPNARLRAGIVSHFEVDEPVFFEEGRFWLVRQPDDSFIALSARSPFRGCTVPWRPTFNFTDPTTGKSSDGWFRDPCHGATFDINGTHVFGPTPRDMDQYPVEIVSSLVIVHAAEDDLIRGRSTGQ